MGFFGSAFFEQKKSGQELGNHGMFTLLGLLQILPLSPNSQCELGAVFITDEETEAEIAPCGCTGLGSRPGPPDSMEGTVTQAPSLGSHTDVTS